MTMEAMEVDDDVVEAIPVMAEAVPIFPPRADAFITYLSTDDFLPGAMTLLYSIKVCRVQWQ